MFRTTTFIAASLALTTAAFAADRAGEATKVLETSRAQAADGSSARFLKVKGPVFTGDVITTNERGQAQIRLVDDTRVVVGPNSRIAIDSFVFDDSTSAEEIALDTIRGAFRFITGRSNKQAYLIKFPGGTIGVRGTEFDLNVDDAGTATLALYNGGVEVCTNGSPRTCTLVERSCTMLVIPRSGDFEWVQNVFERTAKLEGEFRYAFRQRWLDRDFRVETGSCEIRDFNSTPPTDNEQTSPSDGGTPPIVVL